eukprot:8170470-Alexandrium_andersonii.AAC.1
MTARPRRNLAQKGTPLASPTPSLPPAQTPQAERARMAECPNQEPVAAEMGMPNMSELFLHAVTGREAG